MTSAETPPHHRLLVIDDNAAIHEDFRKILCESPPHPRGLEEAETLLFGATETGLPVITFEIDSAYQGREGLDLVRQAVAEGRPYALAFVDVRMPPGWDGIETIGHLWRDDPELQVVLCTAYSDFSWSEIRGVLGETDSLVILKKPFDNIEVLQLTHTLTKKWLLARQARLRLDELERLVEERTRSLEEANEGLQSEIEERKTIAQALRLSENQLRQAQKMEAVGQLAAGIAHDFNNLLTVIQGHTSHLLDGAGTAHPMAESLGEVSAAAKRAAALTRQLLAFSRKQVMQPRVLDLNDVVRNLDRMLTRLIGEHIALQCELSVEPLPVSADAGSLEQVLVNLAVNARDAMPEGGQLRIQTSSVVLDTNPACRNPAARPGPYARLRVSDTGCGMSADTLKHIFEPFFTTKEVGKGTGLGLASVYGILHQHDGWIEVDSRPEQGTTFTGFIPLTGKSIYTSPAPAQPTRETPSHREKILVVEDERAVRRITCLVLEENGYQVFPAENGTEALALWQTHHGAFDLVLTDMVLPGGISGRDLAQRMLSVNPRLKILYSSGYSAELALTEATEDSHFSFLPKPYDIAELTRAVRKCLDGDGRGRDEKALENPDKLGRSLDDAGPRP